ncbi:unnamed protein product [Candidula unifasciata]|uniref:J domain-containing protein n=1 Tax=Candidula unifasciata TaxID=100452 RepID=A0A8S3YSM8_9EUPU|nr:unnamed protein product [Candidula unifasciata]
MYRPAVILRKSLACKGSDHCLEQAFSGSFFHTCQQLSSPVERQPKQTVSESYHLLGVSSECTEDELRTAYLKKAKDYHPDGQMPTSDGNKFIQVQDAYKTAMNHKRGQAILTADEDRKAEDEAMKYKAPQHRRYLTYEGIGFGPPSRREQIYKQYRVAQASESVYEHRLMKHGIAEDALITRDKTEARKIKISNLIDRVVDDLIRESMQRGDFDNLAGSGKPLKNSDYNPFIDLTTHNINKILVNNGFKPEWIMLSKEIRDGIAEARTKLADVREKLGPPPYSQQDQKRLMYHKEKFAQSVQEINKKINKYNFIVPFMEKQMVHYNVESNMQKVLDNPRHYLSTDERGHHLASTTFPLARNDDTKIEWREVWSNIKQVFTLR